MQARAFIYFVTANVLGGVSYAVTEAALRGFTPTGLVFCRLALGTLLVLPWLLAAARRGLSRGDWARAAAVGLVGLAAPLWIGTVGQELSSSTNAALLIGVEPVSIALLSVLFLGERMTAARAAAIALGLCGAFLIVWQGAPLSGLLAAGSARGDLLLFAHGFFWALYSVIGKAALKRIPPLEFTALATFFALLPLSAAAWPWTGAVRAWPVSLESAAAVVFLAGAVGVAGVYLWNKALELLPASKIAAFIFLQPLIGVLLGTTLFGERFTSYSATGGFLVLAGVYAAMREENAEAQGAREVRGLPQGA